MSQQIKTQNLPVQNKTEIIERLQKHQTTLQKLGVQHCGLFGSFIGGNINAQSDVDLLVRFNPEQKTFDNFMNLCFFLEDILGRSVDVVTPESLSPYIGPHILEEVEDVLICA